MQNSSQMDDLEFFRLCTLMGLEDEAEGTFDSFFLFLRILKLKK